MSIADADPLAAPLEPHGATVVNPLLAEPAGKGDDEGGSAINL